MDSNFTVLAQRDYCILLTRMTQSEVKNEKNGITERLFAFCILVTLP
jgi:hypothetical protein